MAFKCYALFFVICFLGCRNRISVRSAAVQYVPIYYLPVPADVAHEAHEIPPIPPPHELPSSAMTPHHGGLHSKPPDTIINFVAVAASVAITFLLCLTTGSCKVKFDQLHKEQIDGVLSIVSDHRLTDLTKFLLSAIDEYSHANGQIH